MRAAAALSRCTGQHRETVLAELLALVVPPRCAACRAPAARAGDPLCGGCRRALPWLDGPLCPRCALPAPCGRRCPARHAAFSAAWAPVAYEGVARDAVRALKFAAARGLADAMGAQIAAGAPEGLLAPAGVGLPAGAASRSAAAVLVPVPSHPSRRRARGFDPAELLARGIARRSGLTVVRALGLRGPARRQLGASRGVRLAAGRIDVVARGPAPAVAVLVDDVHTTGATLHACAGALLAAGSRRVVAVTWARTPDRR